MIAKKPVSKKISSNSLESEVKSNVTTSMKKGGVTTPLKTGAPLDHVVKHQSKDSITSPFQPFVGISKGLTKNMDNYESFRADVWITDVVHEGETQEEALSRLSEIVDKQLQFEVYAILPEE